MTTDDQHDEPRSGVRCPRCNCPHVPVLYTRSAPFGRTKRVRECRYCGRRVVTYEAASDEAAPTPPGH